MAGAYWIGTDGNTYMKGDNYPTVTKWIAPMLSPQQMGYTQIADPVNPPTTTTQATTAPAPTAPVAPAPPPLNQGAVTNTQMTIDQIPALLAAALQAEDQTFTNTRNQFDAEEGAQRGTYGTSTVTNQKNYDSNFMDSIRAGIHGLGGLMALLRGSGAAGGTAEEQVHDVVGGTTATDIRGGADTRDANQQQLDSTLTSFLTSLQGKRHVNEDTHVNNRSAIQRDENTQLQDLYGKMAGYYGDAQMVPQRDQWLARAGSLTPVIAANSKTQVSPYDTTPVVVHAPNLTAFAAPTQPNVLAGPSDGQVGTGIFTMSNRRKTPALASAGA